MATKKTTTNKKEEAKETKKAAAEKTTNKKILYLNCPLENDVLEESIKILQKKNVKITIFFAQCNLSSLNMLMALLDKNIELNIANCPHSLINPHVIESLNKDFNVNII